MAVKNQVLEILYSFKTHLLKTPLLLGWLLIGSLVALYLDGWKGLAFSLINLSLIGLYALFIRWMTPKPPAPLAVGRPTLELVLTLGLFGLFLLVQLFDFGIWNIQPWQGHLRTFFLGIGTWVHRLIIFPEWIKQDIYLAATSTIKQLLPTLLMFLVLGYRRLAMGLARPHWKLTATLLGSTAAIGFFTGYLTRAPVAQVIALYGIGIFINALPEELFFRGLLLPRLEKIFANPLNALVVSALLFNTLHLPIALYNGESSPMALLGIFSIGYP